jgi:uncharacterized protein (TIGR03032 family)
MLTFPAVAPRAIDAGERAKAKATTRNCMATDTGTPRLEITASPQFVDWLLQQQLSLAFTTYQAGKLYLVGAKPDGRLSVFQRAFERCLGLCADASGGRLWLATRFQIWRLENMLPAGTSADGFDALFVPQAAYTTGDVDAHDVMVDRAGRAVFVNTLFSCLAVVSERYSFEPLWQPAFVSRLAGEDRCHLNGVAVRDSQPAFVTACSETDVRDGWREQRSSGGCVIDVQQNAILARGLSMPHSPRWRRNRLWLLDSGKGALAYVDLKTGRLESVCFCPGFARGLDFAGDYAVVGLSKPRETTFRGLPLEEELQRRQAQPQCGVNVVDLRSGEVVHWLRLEGATTELYDVAVLPGVVRPKALGVISDEIRHSVWFPSTDGRTIHWSAKAAP